MQGGWRSLVKLAPLASQGMGDCCAAAATAEHLGDCCCCAAYGAGLRGWENGEKEAAEKEVPLSDPTDPQ